MDHPKAAHQRQLSAAGRLSHPPVHLRGRAGRLPAEQSPSPAASEGPTGEGLVPLTAPACGPPHMCLQRETRPNDTELLPVVLPWSSRLREPHPVSPAAPRTPNPCNQTDSTPGLRLALPGLRAGNTVSCVLKPMRCVHFHLRENVAGIANLST